MLGVSSPHRSLNQSHHHSKHVQLWLQNSSRPHHRKMHCLEQLNGQALFLTQRRCVSLPVWKKQCHRVYAIVEQPSRSIILGALFFRFSFGEQAWPKVLTCAKFMWQYKTAGGIANECFNGKSTCLVWLWKVQPAIAKNSPSIAHTMKHQ